MRNSKKQTENQKLKSTVAEMKSSQEGLNGRYELTEEGNNICQNSSIVII
jgi:hypothetical protein